VIILIYMPVYEEAIIGKRFTLVIPKSIREELGLKEGQRVLVCVEAGRVIIEPLPENPLQVLESIIGKPYSEATDEEKAEKWLRENAGH